MLSLYAKLKSADRVNEIGIQVDDLGFPGGGVDGNGSVGCGMPEEDNQKSADRVNEIGIQVDDLGFPGGGVDGNDSVGCGMPEEDNQKSADRVNYARSGPKLEFRMLTVIAGWAVGCLHFIFFVLFFCLLYFVFCFLLFGFSFVISKTYGI